MEKGQFDPVFFSKAVMLLDQHRNRHTRARTARISLAKKQCQKLVRVCLLCDCRKMAIFFGSKVGVCLVCLCEFAVGLWKDDQLFVRLLCENPTHMVTLYGSCESAF